MTNKILLISLFLAASLGSYAQCEYQFQPGPDEGHDAVCYNYPICERPNGNPRPCDTTNAGSSPHIYMSARQVGGLDQIMRSFLKFDFSQIGEVPANCLPTKATLELFYYRNPVSDDDHIGYNPFYIERVVEDWSEDTVRWQYPISSGNLRMPTVSQNTGDANRIFVGPSSSTTADYTVDITDMVQLWFEHPDSNFGFRMKLLNEAVSDTGRQVHLASSNYPDAQFRPRINITFPCMEANAGPDTFVCAGDRLQLSADGGEDYLWAPIDASNDPLSDNTIKQPSLNPGQNQSFYVTATLGSCTDNDTIAITTENRGPADILAPTGNDTTICEGDSVELRASGATVYRWEPTEGLSNPNTFNTYAKPDTSTSYVVFVSEPGDKCPGVDTVRIIIENQLETTLSFTDTTICLGDSVQLVANGTGLFRWDPPQFLDDSESSSPWASPDDSTCFVVETYDVGRCSDFDTVCVNVTASTNVDAGNDQTICEGDTINLSPTGPNNATYFWSNGLSLSDAFTQNPKAFPDKTTTYQLTVDGGGACDGRDSVTITVNTKPSLNVNLLDSFMCVDDTVTLIARGSQNYWWDTEDVTSSIVFQPVREGDTTASVVGSDVENGQTCYSDTITIRFSVTDCGDNEKIKPPKFITPNGDGFNDEWVIKDIDKFDNTQVTIFNRWGDVVYQKNAYTNDWDGTYSGQPLPEETYLYVIKISFRGEEEVYNGTVTILRDENSK